MKQIISSSLFLIILFCLAEFIFQPTYLFYEIWWLDIPMHILGGFGIASLTAAILSYKNKKISYKAICLSYLVIAIVWELWEYWRGVVNYIEWNGWADTIKDFITGFIGLSIGYIFVRK